MIVPAIFKIEKINTHKPANCNYICSIDIYNDLFVVNLFDKKEQRVIFNTKGEHREEIIKFVDEEYGCNNI